jgi:hypothetical protein
MFNTKHRVAKLGTLLAVASLGLTGLTGIASAQAAAATTTFKIHLDQIAPQAQGWNLWWWGAPGAASNADTTPNFDQEDGYGVYTQFDVTKDGAIGSISGFPRTTEDWNTATKPFGDNNNGTFGDVVDGAVNEYWCTIATHNCTKTAPAPTFEVRVHVNKQLADIGAWNIWTWGGDHGSPEVNPGFTYSDDLGSYASFKLVQDGASNGAAPSSALNGATTKTLNQAGIIVRGDAGWSFKETGSSDQGAKFGENGVAEIWCEVVDTAALGCQDHAPDPVTHVTVHINQPLDATHNYVVWDNHVTNNTDVLFAPTFATEDRYGAIAKFKFTDPAIKDVRFYITDGRSFDAPKITGASDMSVPITTYNGEVWCDVVASTPTCSSTPASENVTVTVHINAPAATTEGWNVGYQGLGNPTGSDGTPNVVADGDANSVVTWTVNNVLTSSKSDFEWLLRNKENWDSASGEVQTAGDLIKPTGGSNLKANITGSNVEIWCDATNYANPTYNDPPTAAFKTPLVPLVCSQAPKSLTVHYNRPMSELSGWEIAAFGTGPGGDTRVQFTGSDAFGSTAVIHYNNNITDTGAISFVVRKYQAFAAATASSVQVNLDPWSCIDAMADCTGGFFRQTTGNRVVPSGADEVWALAGSNEVSDGAYDAMPSNDIKLTATVMRRGKVMVSATAGAGTTPTAIVVDVLTRKGVSVKPGISCTIGKSSVGTTLGTSCTLKGLKKGVKYRLWAHALTYGVGSSAHSRRTAVFTAK